MSPKRKEPGPPVPTGTPPCLALFSPFFSIPLPVPASAFPAHGLSQATCVEGLRAGRRQLCSPRARGSSCSSRFTTHYHTLPRMRVFPPGVNKKVKQSWREEPRVGDMWAGVSVSPAVMDCQGCTLPREGTRASSLEFPSPLWMRFQSTMPPASGNQRTLCYH